MSTKKTTLNTGLRTLLIIIGIILAAFLTWNSSLFVSHEDSFLPLPFVADKTITAEPKEAPKLKKLVNYTEVIKRILPRLEK